MPQIDPNFPASAAGKPTRRLEFPDIFEGAEKKTRPASCVVQKSPAELFAFFRNFANFPKFAEGITRVEQIDERTHRWTAQAKGGDEKHWETEILDEVPGQMVAWRVKPGSILRQTAAFLVEPAVGGRGTIVSLKLSFDTTIGKLIGQAERPFLSDPDAEAAITVRRFKALMETGEVPTTEGQPTGRGAEDVEEKVA